MFAAIERFLGQAGPWSLVVIFIVIVLESAAGLGVIFPGEAMAVIAGAMAADDFFSPWTALAVVALAAMIGDLTGYTIGQKKGKAVLARWAFARRQYEKHRKRIEYYFDRYGGATGSSAVSSRWDALSSPSRRVCPGCDSGNSCRCQCSLAWRGHPLWWASAIRSVPTGDSSRSGSSR